MFEFLRTRRTFSVLLYHKRGKEVLVRHASSQCSPFYHLGSSNRIIPPFEHLAKVRSSINSLRPLYANLLAQHTCRILGISPVEHPCMNTRSNVLRIMRGGASNERRRPRSTWQRCREEPIYFCQEYKEHNDDRLGDSIGTSSVEVCATPWERRTGARQ